MRKTVKEPLEDSNQKRVARLARGFAAVVIAETTGVKSIDRTLKKIADEPVGEFWLSLGRLVHEWLKARGGVGPEHLMH